jgi:hypothetical protein
MHGQRLKCYAIVHPDAPWDAGRFEAGVLLAARERPAAAPAVGRPGLGFLILHQGATGDYAVLGWWDRENELPLRVFVRDGGAWRPAHAGEGVCVWDLEVIWHERCAYVATLLASPAGTAEAYLARTFAAATSDPPGGA